MSSFHEKATTATLFIYRQFRVRPLAVCAFFLAIFVSTFVPDIARDIAGGAPAGRLVLLLLITISVGVTFAYFAFSFLIYYSLRVNGLSNTEIEERIHRHP